MLETFRNIKQLTLDVDSESILKGMHDNSKSIHYSHKINGRWENQYLDIHLVPEIKTVFKEACKLGKEIIKAPLVVPNKSLGLAYDEFWFNNANPGESTGWHDHKDGASLSAVFYLEVPRQSGDIQFRLKKNGDWITHTIQSKKNHLILFKSNLEHSVAKNQSKSVRSSLAFNLFTLPLSFSNKVENYSSKKFFT